MIRNYITTVLLIVTSTLSAQRTNSSLYSFFGIGNKHKFQTVEQASMGGIGAAISSKQYLNFTNPATLSNLRVATYNLAGNSNFLTINDGKNTQSTNTTSLSYIALGFPLGKKAGMSFGLQPYSSVGYSLINEKMDNNNTLNEITQFSGNGGTNRIFGNFGIKLIDNLSVGIEANYIFGNIEHSILEQRLGVVNATKNVIKSNIKGSSIKVGMYYEHLFKNKLKTSFGSSLKLSDNIDVSGENQLYAIRLSSTGGQIIKSTLPSITISKKIKSPMKFTFGGAIGKENKWQIGGEYEFGKAIEDNNAILNTNTGYQFGDTKRVSFGGYIIPKRNSISSYWDRITYRAGARYEDIGLLVKKPNSANDYTTISEFGINIGLGLPLPKQLSTVNIGLEYGQRGTLDNNLIKENYYNLKIGLSLSDLNWFLKRKID